MVGPVSGGSSKCRVASFRGFSWVDLFPFGIGPFGIQLAYRDSRMEWKGAIVCSGRLPANGIMKLPEMEGENRDAHRCPNLLDGGRPRAPGS